MDEILLCFALQLFSGRSYAPNTLLFGMFESYYGAPDQDVRLWIIVWIRVCKTCVETETALQVKRVELDVGEMS